MSISVGASTTLARRKVQAVYIGGPSWTPAWRSSGCRTGNSSPASTSAVAARSARACRRTALGWGRRWRTSVSYRRWSGCNTCRSPRSSYTSGTPNGQARTQLPQAMQRGLRADAAGGEEERELVTDVIDRLAVVGDVEARLAVREIEPAGAFGDRVVAAGREDARRPGMVGHRFAGLVIVRGAWPEHACSSRSA